MTRSLGTSLVLVAATATCSVGCDDVDASQASVRATPPPAVIPAPAPAPPLLAAAGRAAAADGRRGVAIETQAESPSEDEIVIVVDEEPSGPGFPQPIEDPTGVALDGFYAALSRSDAREPGAITRVLHMGDSSIGLDGLPSAIRRRMQERFGDAGAGFVLMYRGTHNYKNKLVSMKANKKWDVCYIAYLCKKDGHYGLGGHVFRGKVGANTLLKPAPNASFGREVSRIEVWYAAQRSGARMAIQVDDTEPVVVDTKADQLEDRWHEIRVDPGPHSIKVRSAGGGRLRAYGVVLENDGPGVVWDTVSMIGAFTKRLHGYDDEHIASQISHRDPDLLVLNYGGNDLRRLVTKSLTPEKYKNEFRKTIKKLRAGRKQLPCLVASVIDHGRSGRQVVEAEHIDPMVQAQREVAFEQGCGFFDTVAAMGGAGSLVKWFKMRPRYAEPDLKHLNGRGRDHMGQMMFDALMAGYQTYRREASGK